MLLGRSSNFPVAVALGISVYSVDHLAPMTQPEVQNPIISQAGRPSRGTELIAEGPISNEYPALFAE